MAIQGRAGFAPSPVEDGGFSTTSGHPDPLTTITLVPIATQFNNPIGIDHHEPTNQVVMSVNFGTGEPRNFELVAPNGTRTPFSNIHGFTDEVKIATVRTGPCQAGFTVGTLFTGTGAPGVIARIAPDGSSVANPWVTLPNEDGLMRGSLFQDRYCVFAGDLIVVTTVGNVWRVTSAGSATRIAALGTHLEGLTTVPNDSRYGPWAGKILAGAEDQGCLYDINVTGTATCWALGINPEDVDIILPDENFYGVDFTGRTLWGADASQWTGMVGDFTVAQEMGGTLWHVRWNGTAFTTNLLATVGQWEHMTFSPARLPTKNAAPTITSFSASPGSEGTAVRLRVNATDPDGDPLTYRWDFDGDGTWDTPFSTNSSVAYTFGDDWSGQARVDVSDGNLTATASTSVTVQNVPPVVTSRAIEPVKPKCDDEHENHDGEHEEHGCGDRDDDHRCHDDDHDRDHGVRDRGGGGDRDDDHEHGHEGCGCGDRDRDDEEHDHEGEHGNDDDDGNGESCGATYVFNATAFDPGSDDLTFFWDFGDGTNASHTYFNNGISPDPHPSPGPVFPVNVTNVTTHTYTKSGNFTVTLNVTDDDGGIVTVIRYVLVCDGDDEHGDHDGEHGHGDKGCDSDGEDHDKDHSHGGDERCREGRSGDNHDEDDGSEDGGCPDRRDISFASDASRAGLATFPILTISGGRARGTSPRSSR